VNGNLALTIQPAFTPLPNGLVLQGMDMEAGDGTVSEKGLFTQQRVGNFLLPAQLTLKVRAQKGSEAKVFEMTFTFDHYKVNS